MLVEAFNDMAAELQENREVITRSTAELRRSNRALDERRRYIETLLANLSTAVVSLDPDGRVTTANPAAAGSWASSCTSETRRSDNSGTTASIRWPICCCAKTNARGRESART